MIALNFKMYVGIEFYNYVYYITHTHMYICVYKVNGGLVAKLCLALLQPHGLFCDPARLLFPWDSPGKNTGAGCHFLLQGIFLTQGLNLHLLHYRWILC